MTLGRERVTTWIRVYYACTMSYAQCIIFIPLSDRSLLSSSNVLPCQWHLQLILLALLHLGLHGQEGRCMKAVTDAASGSTPQAPNTVQPSAQMAESYIERFVIYLWLTPYVGIISQASPWLVSM
jgi:hypothetical protein